MFGQSARVVTEEEIKAVLSEDHTVTTEETYDIYLLPPNEDPETCQSYLRMRNRDGKYSLMFEVSLPFRMGYSCYLLKCVIECSTTLIEYIYLFIYSNGSGA